MGNIYGEEFRLKIWDYGMPNISRHTLAVRIFDSISITKTHNRILKLNLYNRVMCRERFMILELTFYKVMIEVQIPLYKTNGVVFPRLCNFLHGEHTEVA